MRKIVEFASENLEEITKKILEETRGISNSYITCNSKMANTLKENCKYVFSKIEKTNTIGKVTIIGKIADINIFADPDIKGDNNIFIIETN